MTKAVRVHKVGGPEALVYESVDVPAPGPGEVRIRQHAVGLNFIDVYYRTGLYKAPGPRRSHRPGLRGLRPCAHGRLWSSPDLLSVFSPLSERHRARLVNSTQIGTAKRTTCGLSCGCASPAR